MVDKCCSCTETLQIGALIKKIEKLTSCCYTESDRGIVTTKLIVRPMFVPLFPFAESFLTMTVRKS